MIDRYALTFQRTGGSLFTVELMAENQEQALYAALEMFPDWRLVRCSRDTDRKANHHGPAAAGH